MKSVVSILLITGEGITLTSTIVFDPDEIESKEALAKAANSMRAKIAGYEYANE